MKSLYVGLMSGTSLDGVDSVLVEFDGNTPHVHASLNRSFNPDLRTRLLSMSSGATCTLSELGQLDHTLGRLYGEVVNDLLAAASIQPQQVEAIGSHGQTIKHQPFGEYPFTLQIGDPNALAMLTGIPVVSDFRRRDIAGGGQGAPFAPSFHKAFFAKQNVVRVIANIGGIANITILNGENLVGGFDTGPGNILMDGWAQKHLGAWYDSDGQWARRGQVLEGLLSECLQDDFFKRSPPKSTGRERFNMGWLALRFCGDEQPTDVQATLLALTGKSLAQAVDQYVPQSTAVEIYLCGGGAKNQALVDYIVAALPAYQVATTHALGLPVELIEAVGFAWLARERIMGRKIDLTKITGAHESASLGGIYCD